MSRIVGIDLGTTNSLVATVEGGMPLVIPDLEGRRLTPSTVHVPGPEAQPVVGEPASRVRILKPRETVYSIKRFMGRRAAELGAEERDVAYALAAKGPELVSVEIHGRQWSPEAISAEILKKLKQDAEAYLGEGITRAVITVPAYFNDAQRTATRRAGELAGFAVERILNEPTAAALAYGLDRLQERARVAVYDLGGGTFDLSILELREGVFEVLATQGNTCLGGDDIDRCLVSFLEARIGESTGLDTRADLVLTARLREAAEDAKIRLSTAMETRISLPFLDGTASFEYVLTRGELEELSREIVQRTRTCCARALADAGVEPGQLDEVILVGGQTRMPLVRQLVAEVFGCVEPGGRGGGPQLNTSQNPEEAVALGAAIQAEILSGGFRDLLLLDVTPLSLGIETFGGLMNVIIPRNTTIPVKAGEVFTTAVDHQREMLIHVLQGERERARDNWSLGRFTLEFEPAPRGLARVGVQFEIDADGILHVLARDLKTGLEKNVPLQSAVDVNDADVQRMIEESVAHAFEDLTARRWIESRLQAEATVRATRRALEEFPEAVDAAYRAGVEEALRAVDAALATEDPQRGEGDGDRLRDALKRLDEATRPLAALMMDRAMERLLRQKGLISG